MASASSAIAPGMDRFLTQNSSTASLHEPHREPRLRLLIAANGSRDVAYAETIAVRLSKERKISVKIVVDELTHRLTQQFHAQMNCSLDRTTMKVAAKDIQTAQRQAFELVEWADLLVLAPIDALSLGKMITGIADTLMLEVLRSWDISKRVLLVPGMSTHEWENPVTKKQMSKLQRKWQWIRVMAPILWHWPTPLWPIDKKPIVSWDGFTDLIGIIKNQADLLALGYDVDVAARGMALASVTKATSRLPPEIWSIILEYTNDWELAKALGVCTNMPMPTEQGWRLEPSDPSNPRQVFMHELEWTLLSADTAAICKKLSEAPATIHDLSALAIKLIFKFSLTGVLTHIEAHCPLVFRNFDGKTIPTKASAYYGRTEILDWWARSPSFLERQYDAEAVDGASKNGYLHVLEWWRRSGLPFKYSEVAFEQASARGHVRILEWWREQSLSNPDIVLKPGRSLMNAAQYGRVDVIRWWEESGVNVAHQDSVCKTASRWGKVEVLEAWRQLRGDNKISFNSQILVEPTIHSHINVLSWWKDYARGTLPGMNGQRGKKVEYRTMDIEEALEDSIGDQRPVRKWWAENGLNLGLGTSEWMKSRYL